MKQFLLSVSFYLAKKRREHGQIMCLEVTGKEIFKLFISDVKCYLRVKNSKV